MALVKSLVFAAVVLAAFAVAEDVSAADEIETLPLPKPAIPAVGPVRKFTCVFFPGIGQDWPELDVPEAKRSRHPKFLRREFEEFWGAQLPNRLRTKCEDLILYDTDTSYRAWDDPTIAKEFDKVLEQQKPHVVFAHGFSNLVLANCKHMKLKSCAKIGSKIEWFGIAAPLRGTEAPNVMPKLCPALTKTKEFKDGGDCVELPTKTNPPTYDVSDAWKSLEPSKVPKWVYKTAENDMSGSACGIWAADYTQAMATADATAFGSIAKALSTYKPKGRNSRNERYRPDPEDWLARNIITSAKVPKTGNDGIVALSSCAIRAMSKYKKLPTAKYYALGGDHDFSTGSKGDIANSGVSEPLTWIVNMVDRVRKANKYPARFAQLHDADAEAEGETEAQAQADESEADADAESAGESEAEAAAAAAADAELASESAAFEHELDLEEQAEEEEDAAEDAAEEADEAADDAAEDAELDAEDNDAAVEPALHQNDDAPNAVVIDA